MQLFGKTKEQSIKAPPIDKIKVMSRMGIGEKEIVKQLKSEGYTFTEIEGAMMQAMKEGVESPLTDQYSQSQSYASQSQPMQQMPIQQPLPQQQERPGAELSWPRLERPEEMFPETQDELSPEVAMEDLIENITYEKFEKYNKQLQSLAEHLDSISTTLGELERKASEKQISEVPKEYDERLDNLEAKINGLEKAIKQALPSLTQSIDELKSAMEHLGKTPIVASKSSAVPDQEIYQKYYPSVPLFATTKNQKLEETKEEKKELKQEA